MFAHRRAFSLSFILDCEKDPKEARDIPLICRLKKKNSNCVLKESNPRGCDQGALDSCCRDGDIRRARPPHSG